MDAKLIFDDDEILWGVGGITFAQVAWYFIAMV